MPLPQTDWEALSELVRAERREGKRVPLSFPIEVTGRDAAGQTFAESTTTLDVSEGGCRFKVKSRIQQGGIVAIRLLTKLSAHDDAGHPLLFEICWVDKAGDSWMAGAKQLQPENLWHVSFPAPPAKKVS